MIAGNISLGTRALKHLLLAALLACVAHAHAKNFEMRTFTLPREAVRPGSRVHFINLLGDQTRECVVINDRELTVFRATAKSFEQVHRFMLPEPAKTIGKTYYGFARLSPDLPAQILIMLPDGIWKYAGDGATIATEPTQILTRRLIQGQAGGAATQYFEFAMDLNNDGLDELLLPEENSFAIFRQTAPGQFAPVRLPRNPFKRTIEFDLQRLVPDSAVRVPSLSGSLSYRRGVESLLFFDANGDGLQDLIYTSNEPGPNSREMDRYDVFIQKSGFAFDSTPSHSFSVPFEPGADTTFRDLNRDGRLDAMVIKSNMDFVNPRTVLRFYIAGKQQTQILSRETNRFVAKDPIGIVRIADFNNDSATDFAITNFSYQFGSTDDIVDLALANKVKFKLLFYLGGSGDAGSFSRDPAMEKELIINFKPESYGGYPPVMFPPDINGDKFVDLVVRTEETNLAIFPSESSLALPSAAVQNIPIPADAEVAFDDVNGDGLVDMITAAPKSGHLQVHISSTR